MTTDGRDQRSLSSTETSPPEAEASESRQPPRKRRRTVISCTECHRRKQKCDRGLPCTNCRSRGKESACEYETGAPTAKEQGKTSIKGSNEASQAQTLSSAAADYGYAQGTGSTLQFIKKIEAHHRDAYVPGESAAASNQEQHGLKERYKSLIRHLPASGFSAKLIKIYFREVNPIYFPLEEDIFMQQLGEWNNMSFSALSNLGPKGLSPELRVFPALLFQVLALGLFMVTEEPSEFDQLKYAGQMTFEDLAAEYSNSGISILDLLGKRQITLTTVQTSFLRASVLKFTGQVTESWHTVGSAIRDAQEIGMHRDSHDPKPASDDTGDILENMWLIQQRRRLYMVLAIWDAHCCVVLGRPGAIDWNHMPTLALDAPTPKDRRRMPPQPRDENVDPPTPITKQLVSYRLILTLVKIMELESDGPCPKTYEKVDQVQDRIMREAETIPAYFRMVNPDRRWDDHPSCWWIGETRRYLPQIHYFSLIALHRPYLFHREKSRSAALHASIDQLTWQMESFKGLDPSSWRNFDAAVLLASIYVLFPQEHLELAETADIQFKWTLQRFEAMQERNRLAKASRGVLHAIYAKFKKVIEGHTPSNPSCTPGQAAGGSTTGNSNGATSSEPASTIPSTMETPLSSETNGNSSYGTTPSQLPGPGAATGMAPDTGLPAARGLQSAGAVPVSLPALTGSSDWPSTTAAAVQPFDFSNMTPLYPIGDIIYNNLDAFGDGTNEWDGGRPMEALPGPMSFEGDFGDDSFWNLMNQYNAGSGSGSGSGAGAS